MKTKSFPHKTFVVLVVVLLIQLNSTVLHAQAVSNPNQITGTIEFSNTNPDILAILNGPTDDPPGLGQGIFSWGLEADSIGISPSLNTLAGANVVPPSRVSIPYSVTVEVSPDGIRYLVIPYDVRLHRVLDFFGDFYSFTPKESPPVFPEPAADAVLNFRECAALLDIRWIDEFGNPVPVSGLPFDAILVLRESVPGSGNFNVRQAGDTLIPAGQTQEYLAVRGDGTACQVNMTVQHGTDPSFDQMTFFFQHTVVANCDEIIRLDCVIPSTGLTGEIAGRVDILGKDERAIIPLFEGTGTPVTSVTADQGPLGNFRYNAIPANPSQGSFRLENLFPSDAVIPARGYRVYGEMGFGFGRSYQYFMTPHLFAENFDPSPNKRVSVAPGAIADLQDTFVISPGYVRGNIVLAGPPIGPNGSCLEDLIFNADFDLGGPGIPDDPRVGHRSQVAAAGRPLLAPGATLTSEGGFARAGFEGSFNPATANYEGHYELALGGLKQEPTIWKMDYLLLALQDVDTPELPGTYQDSGVRIENDNAGDLTIVPGETITLDMDYCFSQVNIGFRAVAGEFTRPQVQVSGSFDGIDFRGEPTKYKVGENAFGTPTSEPSNEGLVVVCLPQGSYTISPSVQVQNSRTALPSFQLEVGCRQVINPTLDLQLSLDSVPECSRAAVLPVSGRVNSRGNVERIFYTINDGPQIEVCVNCGADPSFSFEATLTPCENRVTVTAEDEFGDAASASSFVRFDAAAPILTGCENIFVKVGGNATGATVNFAVTATDNCDSTAQITCVPPSGAFFPLGETRVICIATDKCGNASQCQFTITVTANEPPVARCRNVTVTTGANCAAIASINDGSYDPDAGDTITLSQSPAGPYPLGATLVTLTVTDNHGVSSQCTATVTVANPDPVVTLTDPTSGSIYPVNTLVNFTATFTDAGGGIHTGTWTFDELAQAAMIVEPSGASPGSASATHSFTTPGVYSVKLTITDVCGGSATADQVNGMEVLVVVYDPDGGFVTGGGWITSPAGACTANPSLTGKANFGFVSKYQKGANVPTGDTEFQFKAGDLNFKSTSYDWLVVTGAKAKYKGSGRINGSGDYAFQLSATDGQVNGGGGMDKFRIKIWEKSVGGVIYDNQQGDPDTADATTALGGGSIVVHKP